MLTLNTKQRAATEMAMPVPTAEEVELYERAFPTVDEFPTPQELRDIYSNMSMNKIATTGLPLPRSLHLFTLVMYPKIFDRVIKPLQQELWPLRHNPDELSDYISAHPIFYGTKEKYDPLSSGDPVRQSLQNLKEWAYYWTHPIEAKPLYTLLRPELLRQINELKTILSKHVKAQRRTTPRSVVPTAGPALRTPDVELEEVYLDDEPVWRVTTTVYVKGGFRKHVFADYFDTEWHARRSPLMKEARTLTPEQYVTKFIDYELIKE